MFTLVSSFCTFIDWLIFTCCSWAIRALISRVCSCCCCRAGFTHYFYGFIVWDFFFYSFSCRACLIISPSVGARWRLTYCEIWFTFWPFPTNYFSAISLSILFRLTISCLKRTKSSTAMIYCSTCLCTRLPARPHTNANSSCFMPRSWMKSSNFLSTSAVN